MTKKKVTQMLVDAGLVQSMSMARRAVVVGAVKVNDQPIGGIFDEVDVEAGTKVQVGNREIVLENTNG